MSEKQYSWCVYENYTEFGFRLESAGGDQIASVFRDKDMLDKPEVVKWQIRMAEEEAGGFLSAEDSRAAVEERIGIETRQTLSSDEAGSLSVYSKEESKSEKQYSWRVYENETERGFTLEGNDSTAVFRDKRCSRNEIDCQLWQIRMGNAQASHLNSAEDGRGFVEGWLGITTGQILRHWGAWSGSDLRVCEQLDDSDWVIECPKLSLLAYGPTLDIARDAAVDLMKAMADAYRDAKPEDLTKGAKEQAKVLLNYRSVEDLYNHSKEGSK